MYNSENNRIVPNGSSYMYTNGYCPTYQSYPNQNYYSYTNADYQSSYPVRYNNHHTEQSTVPLNGSVVYSPVQNTGTFVGNNDLQTNAYETKSNVGMTLLQKMGWNPGEGLGKFKDGQVEPLKVRLKYGKMGLMSYEEYMKEQENSGLTKRDKDFPKLALKDKHPVTALMEYSAKQHLLPPTFKSYIDMPAPVNQYSMSVVFQDTEYKPPGIFKTKKDAKKAAATLCLKTLNVL